MIPRREYDRDHIAELIPAVAYDPESKCFVLSSGDRATPSSGGLGFIFCCQPLTGGDDALADRLGVLLNQDWPKETIIQFTLAARPDIVGHLENYVAKRECNQPFLRELNELQAEFLRESVDTGLYTNRPGRARDVSLYISVQLPGDPTRKPTADEIQSARRRFDAVESILEGCYLHPQAMNPSEYIRLLQSYLDPRPDAVWRQNSYPAYDESTEIRKQVVDPGAFIYVDPDKVQIGKGRIAKMLSTKRWPEQVYFGQARRYLGDLLTGSRGIYDHCLLTMTCYIPDNESKRQKFTTKRNWVTNAATGPLAKFLPQLLQQKQSFDALFEAVDQGDRLIQVGFSCVLFTTAEEEVKSAANAATYLREAGFQFFQDQFITLAVMLNAIPMCADRDAIKPMERFRTMATRHIVGLAPLFADWKGTGSPMLAPVSRNGQVMTISPFDSDESYNLFVAGSSGGGKSFSVNDLVIGNLSMGGKAWIIDLGRSYSKICEILNGQILDFDSNSKVCLNPFEMVEDFDAESDMLVQLLQSMASTNDPLLDVQVATMRKILRQLWDEHGNALQIDHVAHALLENPDSDPRVKDVGRQLYAFTTEGEYGRFFNGKNNVRLDSDFVVVELEGLKERRQLLKVVLLMLIYQVRHDMTHGDRSQQKLFIVEEAWSLLEDEVAGSFVAEQFRTARKYGGAAVVVSQNPADVSKSKGGQAIVACCPNVYLLAQRPDVVSALKKESAFGMQDGEFALLESLHTVKGSYSEIMFRTNRGAGVGRLVVPPLKQVLYSTTPGEVEAIKRLQAQGMTILQAVREIARLRERNSRRAA